MTHASMTHAPAMSGDARMHHNAKWDLSSISDMPLPTSSMSLSFQKPGPAHGANGSSMSIIRMIDAYVMPCGQFGWNMIVHMSPKQDRHELKRPNKFKNSTVFQNPVIYRIRIARQKAQLLTQFAPISPPTRAELLNVHAVEYLNVNEYI